MKEKPIVNARKINKMRYISGIIICSIVVIMVFVAIALNLADYYDSGEGSTHTLRMFTTISNVIVAVAAWLCLPFQVDGLRRDRYKLPKWIMMVMYIGAVGVFLTFFVAATLISAYQGFVKAMFTKSNLYMHTINPLLITLLFVLVVPDAKIKFSESLLSLIPVVVYMILYFIMVFVLGVWSDHYYTNKFFPWPISLLIIITLAFGVTQLLRWLHNLSNKHVTDSINKYYLESDDFNFPNIREAISYLAKQQSKFYQEGDAVYIPVDIIELLSTRYVTDKVPMDILQDIYLENYLVNIKIKQ